MWLLSSRGKKFRCSVYFFAFDVAVQDKKEKFLPSVYFLPQNRAICDTGVEKDFQKVRNLQPSEQEALFSIMDCDEVTPSLSQAQRLRRMSEEQRFTDSAAMQLMSEVKGNQVEYVKVPVDKLRSYFRPDTSMKQMTETLVKAMEFYNKHLERQRRDRDAR